VDTAGLAGFREFVAARQTALLRSAYVLCGDRHRAEDLVQGALTRTAARWSHVRDGDPEAYALRWWTPDGREQRTVRTGPPTSPGAAPLSPSGRRVAADRPGSRIAVVDTRTAAVLATPDVPVLAGYGRRDEDHLVVTTDPVTIALLALDGTTRPYATLSDPYVGRVDITRVGR
jgi:hypothetical protein